MEKGDPTFDLLSLLDRLEELREEMLELGVTSISELDARIEELEAQLADVPDGGADGSV